MKLVSFKTKDQKHIQCGALIENRGDGGGAQIKVFAAPSVLELIREGNGGFKNVAAALAQSPKTIDLGQVELLAPLPRPPSMRDGYAFRQHVEAARRNRGLDMIAEFDLFPVFYFTNHHAVFGPGVIPVEREHLNQLDYELEVAIVIGKEGKNIPRARADEYVYGYTIMNDWSARRLQMEEMKLNLGPAKGKDFATSLGPWLVTRDELLETGQLRPGERGEVLHASMKAFINGKQYSQGDVNQMSWTFAEIIQRASYGATLMPGDVIGSGTVGTGCLLELNGSKVTDNLWLQNDDVIRLEIAGLGALENKIALQ